MFITTQGFKKLINEAYKGAGLTIGNDGAGYYISGSYWVIWIMQGRIPKKELAAIIELTGELPGDGERFKATKAGNQYELPWHEGYAAMRHALECEECIEVTPLTLKYSTGQQARILQNTNNGTIVLINERFIDIVDNTVVEYDKGEYQAEGPMISGRMQGVFWRNDTMALHVYTRTDDENKRLIGYLETFDIMGDAENEHRLFGYGLPETGEEKEEESTQEEHTANQERSVLPLCEAER